MKAILQVFLSVFSGVLLALAIPNELYLMGSPFYTLIAIIPFYLAIKDCKSFRFSFVLSFIQTITVHLCSSFWLGYFKDFAALTLGASAFGTGMIGGIFGIFFHFPYYSESKRNRLNLFSLKENNTPAFRIFWFSFIYVLYEWFKSTGFLGYPWGTVSTAVYRWQLLIQIAAITGTYGVTFILVFFNALIAEGFSLYDTLIITDNKPAYRIKLSYTAVAKTWAVSMGLILIYGAVSYSLPRNPEKYLDTIIVQQNSDPWKNAIDTTNIENSMKETEKVLSMLQDRDKKPDLIVWSEGVLNRPFPHNQWYYENRPENKPLIDFIKDNNIPFLVGGVWQTRVSDTKINLYNSTLMFDGNGNLRGHYPKNHLVPFAEAIPFSKIKWIHDIIFKITKISAGWTPGDQYVFFQIPASWSEYHKEGEAKTINLAKSYGEQIIEENAQPTVTISTPICYDDAFPDVCRPLWKYGTEVFMNLTDDSWSLKKSSEFQHFCVAAYRAIEYRTTLVRSTNAGYSVVVDPAGRILYDMPLFEQTSMECQVPVYKRVTTTYALLGNWFPCLLLFLCLLSILYEILIFQKSDYIPSERIIKKGKKHKKASKKDGKKHKKHHKTK